MGLAYSPCRTPDTEVSDDGTEEDRRCEQLRHVGAVLFGEPIFGVPSPVRYREIPTPPVRRVGASDVQRTADTTARLDELGGNLGGIAAVGALTAHVRCTEAMLGADMTEPVRLRVLQVLSDVHRATGWVACDVGLRDRARLHFGGPNDALKLFQLGAAAAPTPLGRATAESHCGHALGALGLVEPALAALRRAHVDAGHAEVEQTSPEVFRSSLQEAAAARRDSGCQGLAHEVTLIRSAA